MKNRHDCRRELKEISLRATPARIAVLKYLEKTDNPVDVSMIKEHLQKNDIQVDQATVFRIINAFTDKGLAKQIQLYEGKFRYELAGRPDHHHLICEVCGTIQDIADCVVEDFEKNVEQEKNFLVKRHSLEFFGVCERCQE